MKKILRGMGIVIVITAVQAGVVSASPLTDGCGKFVQEFYDWYLGKAAANDSNPSSESPLQVTMKERKSSFDPELIKALEEDEAASVKSPDGIVGLDFDPFLNAQDTPTKYVVGEVREKDGHYLVDVFGVWNGKKNSKPDVTPELINSDGKWVFVNFHYGKSDISANDNLISVLRALKEDREKTKP